MPMKSPPEIMLNTMSTSWIESDSIFSNFSENWFCRSSLQLWCLSLVSFSKIDLKITDTS